MSSIKKNTLAAALVAGMGLAGAAAAYNYGTDPAITVPEPVAYQVLSSSNNYKYVMNEALVFDIDIGDNIVGITTGFTVRVRLKDGALFDTVGMTAGGINPNQATADDAPGIADPQSNLVLNPGILGWNVQLDGFDEGGAVAVIRIFPVQGAPVVSQISPGRLLSWYDVKLDSLNEFATGAVTTVNGDFWMVNSTNDAQFVGSAKSAPILSRVSGVTACADGTGADVDKYIDVADNWTESQLPKTRFSEDGKLGTADESAVTTFTAGRGVASQVIDLGDVVINNAGAGGFFFQPTDVFTTVITGGASDNWAAFDHPSFSDDVYLVNGTCSSGTIISLVNGGQGGTVNGNSVTFTYTALNGGLNLAPAAFANRLTVCAFQDTNIVIDDHPNHVTTSFTRANSIPTPAQADVHPTNVCDLLPLRYNGSTMEIFTINPASNTTQRSFIRLTNRSETAGYVSLEGIDNIGQHGDSQVRVWVEAGASVQLDAKDLEEGTNGAIGAWGTGAGKWRAVVTAEFPGLVATSLVNATGNNTLQNITDSDTRGEQYGRDFDEGTFGSEIGERPSDYVQESTPDFHGNGGSNSVPGGPNGSDGPSGGQTTPDGNPGLPPPTP